MLLTNYSTTVAHLQHHQHRVPENFLKFILNMFSEKDLHCIWMLIHAAWTVSYKLE